MLNILEKFVEARGYRYFRLDGSTPVASRQPLITNFNEVHLYSGFSGFIPNPNYTYVSFSVRA